MPLTLLTAPGRSALATLALTGDGAWALASRLFRPHSGKPPLPEPGRFWLGSFGDDLSDGAVLAYHSTRHVEIHCHGGPEVIRLLTETLAHHGAPSQPTQPTHPALALLPHALTTRTAGILLDQFNNPTGDPALYGHVGAHLTVPWRVAVLGPPNAGKSSLINALAGFQRSIVSPTPGTTRDVVSVVIALDGWPVELLDTAGVRQANEQLEEAGIAEGLARAAEADLCIWLEDASASPCPPPAALPHVLRVVNKCDLPLAWEAQPGQLRVSALSGAGLAELAAVLVAALIPDPPPPGAAVLLPAPA
jgi:tRNA modification GTPase